MLAWIVLAATTPARLCLGASAFLAYKDKAQWIWFAAFSLVAGFGGLTVLQTIGAGGGLVRRLPLAKNTPPSSTG